MRKLAFEATCILLFGVVILGSSNAALAQSAAARRAIAVDPAETLRAE